MRAQSFQCFVVKRKTKMNDHKHREIILIPLGGPIGNAAHSACERLAGNDTDLDIEQTVFRVSYCPGPT